MLTGLVSPFIVMLVLALPHVASAACAWVLWSGSSNVEGGPSPLRAFPAYADCAKAAEADMKKVAEDQREHKRQDATITTVSTSSLGSAGWTVEVKSDQHYWVAVWKCLPDTIDPRGPRGAGR
jgi:hypothetical protein